MTSPFRLFRPPYRDLEPLHLLRDLPPSLGVAGASVIWSMPPQRDDAQLTAVRTRPGGMSLIAVLPPAETVGATGEVYRLIELCRPIAVLPHHEEPHPEDLRALITDCPDDLPSAVVDFMRWRGIPLETDLRRLVRRTLELSAELRSVNALARGIYLSRRALGRRFTTNGLPVPSHWLHMGRVLRAVLRMQKNDVPLVRIAYDLGYPDAFALSNQMKRLTGVRPSEARSRLGWEWLLEAWIRKEAEDGGFSAELAAVVLQGETAPRGGALGSTVGAPIPAPSSTEKIGPTRETEARRRR